MRRLSMSRTWRWRSSAFRMPVEYRTMSIVRSVRFFAPSIGRPPSPPVTDHEHPPIGEILRPIDQAGDFLRRENHRESSRDLRKGEVLQQVGALERLDEEEPERRDV